jgi:hypothetical protein
VPWDGDSEGGARCQGPGLRGRGTEELGRLGRPGGQAGGPGWEAAEDREEFCSMAEASSRFLMTFLPGYLVQLVAKFNYH